MVQDFVHQQYFFVLLVHNWVITHFYQVLFPKFQNLQVTDAKKTSPGQEEQDLWKASNTNQNEDRIQQVEASLGAVKLCPSKYRKPSMILTKTCGNEAILVFGWKKNVGTFHNIMPPKKNPWNKN